MWAAIWTVVAVVLTYTPDMELGTNTLWLLIPFAVFFGLAYENSKD